jgi:pimeloyl-ACP methyl ester carboxylesterase
MSLQGTASIAKLVAIDQAPRIVNDDSWAWGVRHVAWGSLEAQIHGELPWSEFEREPEAPAHVQQMLAEVGGIGDFFASPITLRVDHFVSDWRDVLPRVDVPTWVVTSAHSPSFPLEGMQWVTETIPDARLTVYPNSGHCPHWNEYQDFNTDLIAFLTS